MTREILMGVLIGCGFAAQALSAPSQPPASAAETTSGDTSVAPTPRTRATTVDAVTPAQKAAHREVEQNQAILRRRLRNQASPHAIGAAKADVQESRVEPNRADINHLIQTDELGIPRNE